MGFNPGSPGSHPRPKAGAKPLRHPGIPVFPIIILTVLLEGEIMAKARESPQPLPAGRPTWFPTVGLSGVTFLILYRSFKKLQTLGSV